MGMCISSRDGSASALPYDALIIASGATDRLMPVKGWDYAGTYSLGAAQIALKAQAVSIGRRVVFMGTGPLLQLVASQYVQAGADVVALLDTTPFLTQVKALPRLIARPDVLLKGVKLVAQLKLSGIAIHRGVTPLEIHGDAETGVSGVSVRLGSGDIHRFRLRRRRPRLPSPARDAIGRSRALRLRVRREDPPVLADARH